MKTQQEIFDIAVTHLLRQNEKSQQENGFACLYRGAQGRKCGVGPLIRDEDYSPDMETGAPCLLGRHESHHASLVNEALVKNDINMECPETVKLLLDIQAVHDCQGPDIWEESFGHIARDRNLKMPKL